MTFLFGVLSLFCCVYYGVIVVYSGVETSFSAVWLVLAACLALMGLFHRAYPRFRERVPLRLEVSAITVAVTAVAIFLAIEIFMCFHFFSLQKQSVDYVIVLGTETRDGRPGKMLRHRLDKAVEYANVHPNTVFVLSGGRGKGEVLSEATVMYQYLKERGVPEYQMIKEEKSLNTHENMLYSTTLINEREDIRRAWLKNLMAQSGYEVPPDEEVGIRIGVLTSNFHVFRAKSIARQLGVPNVTGIAAKSDPILFLHFSVRECFAIFKDTFMGNM